MRSPAPDDHFYERLAEFYHLLFPVTEAQRGFFSNLIKEHGAQRVLDVACGTGEQAALFRELGLQVSALDNDERMVNAVRAKKLGIDVHLGSMEEVAALFEPAFDMAVCIGNSLPHLPDSNAVRRTLEGMRSLLRRGGLLIASIVNFDWVLRERVTMLPRKETRDRLGRAIIFDRLYDLSELPERVMFSTRLAVDGEPHTARVPLVPVSPAWLTAAVTDLGLSIIGRFAAFDRSPFTDQSPSLILVAQNK